MSLYSNLPTTSDGRSTTAAIPSPITVTPTSPATSTPATSSPSTATAGTDTVAATTPTSILDASPRLPVKPAFAGAPRSVITSRPLIPTSALTPAQRALQIQAAAARSAANLAAAKAAIANLGQTQAHAAAASTAVGTNQTISAPTTPVLSAMSVAPLSSSLSSASSPSAPVQPSTSSSLLDPSTDDGPLSLPIPNEYNPLRPNDYQDYVKHRDALAASRRSKEDEEADHASMNDDHRRGRHHRESASRSHDRPLYDSSNASPSSPSSSPLAPPPSAPASTFSAVVTPPVGAPKLDLKVSSGEEAFARRQALSRTTAPVQQQQQQPTRPQPFVSGGTVNLSADELAANKRQRVAPPSLATASPSLSSSQSQSPSRVLLLLNMVGRGEVDEELEDETADECARFGRVLKATVFEVPDPSIPSEEAVRIFVKFDSVESAQRAITELNGRTFGGRKVKAKFVDESKFNKGQLLDCR